MEPGAVAGKIELLGHVDDPTGLRVHQPTPLSFVIAQRVVSAAQVIAWVAGPARFGAAIVADGGLALKIQRVANCAVVIRVGYRTPPLGHPLLVDPRPT